jgi:hypothetical protein
VKVLVRACRRPPLYGTQSWWPGEKIKAGRGKGRRGGGSGRVHGGAAAWGRGQRGGLGERAVRRLEGDGGATAWGVAAPWPPWKITTGGEEYVGDPMQDHGVALAAAGTLEIAGMAGGSHEDACC